MLLTLERVGWESPFAMIVPRFVGDRYYASETGFTAEDVDRDPSTSRPVIDLARRKASLVLGEPGAGKSTVLRTLLEELDGTPLTHVRILDFKDYSSEQSIELAVQGLAEVALPSGTHKILLLDSVDETRVLLRNFVPFLERTLAKLVSQQWRVIATCRTAEALPALDDVFERIEAGAVKTLLPLRESDFSAIVRERGFDPAVLLSDLRDRSLEFLAIAPFTLNLLCDCVDSTSHISMSRAEVFARAVDVALGQRASADYTATAANTIPPILQSVAAERLAAFAALTGSSGVGLFRPGELTTGLQTELVAGRESRNGADFQVESQHLQYLLGSALFVESGHNQMEFAHRSLRNYLAARCLARWQLSRANLQSALTTSTAESSIPPQMIEIASWLVALDPTAFDWLVTLDPWSLAKGGLGQYSIEIRPILANQLLARAPEGEMLLGWQDQLAGLEHDGLPDQLRAALGQSGSAQSTALRILRDSYVGGLEQDLLDIVNATSDRVADRRAALEILSTQSLVAYLKQVEWAGENFFADDNRAELRGSVLTTLWPEHLSSEETARMIIAPPEGYFGSYSIFLHRLEESMTVEDAAAIVNWQSAKPEISVNHRKAFPVSMAGRTISKLIARALDKWWESSDAPAAHDSTLRSNALSILNLQLDSSESKLPIRKSARSLTEWHEVLAGLISARASQPNAWYSIVSTADSSGERLVDEGDLEWIAAQANALHGIESDSWAALFDQILDITKPEHVELAWTFEGSPLWEKIRHRFDAIDLDSPLAVAARHSRQQMRDISARAAESGITSEKYGETVISIVEDVKGEITKFWHLARWLDVDLKRGTYEMGSNPDLLSSSSAAELDEPVRAQIVELAMLYLEACRLSDLPQRLKRNTTYLQLDAIYKSVHTLFLIDRQRLLENPSIDWTAIIPALFEARLPFDGADRARDVHRELLAQANLVAPEFTKSEGQKALTRAVLGAGSWSSIEDLRVVMDASWWPHLQVALNLASGHRHHETLQLAKGLVPDSLNEWCKARLQNSTHELPGTASHLLESDAVDGFDSLKLLIQSRPSIVPATLLAIAQSERHGAGRLLSIDPDLRLELYTLIRDLFPADGDPIEQGVHAVSPREDLAQWRDSLLASVVRDGSARAVSAIAGANALRPDMALGFALARARESFRLNGWLPLQVEELIWILHRRGSSLIRSNEDLLTAVVAELAVLGGWLVGETPQAFALWNRHKDYESPKTENLISDWYCHGLRVRLNDVGVVVNREVEVRNRTGLGGGLRQDIRVEVANAEANETYRVVIEVKGIWNPEVRVGLPNQLVKDYLVEGNLTHGIYLVVCFDADHIHEKRRAATARKNLLELSDLLDDQAQSAGDGLHVVSVVQTADLPWKTVSDEFGQGQETGASTVDAGDIHDLPSNS
jgi:hypothetical protein